MKKTLFIKKMIMLACAFTLFNNGFGQSINIINSIPTGADVYDSNMNVIGKTPFDLNTLNENIKKIRISFQNYEDVNIALTSKNNKAFKFPECIESAPYSLINFEYLGGKNDSWYGTLRLRHLNSIERAPIMVSIDTANFDMNKDSELGKLNGKKKYLNDKDISLLIGHKVNLGNLLVKALDDSYLEAYPISSTEKEKVSMYKPKIILRPVIKEVFFNLNGKAYRDYRGPCILKCNWQILEISDRKKVLAEIPVITSFYRTGGSYDIILHQLIAESGKDLTEIDTLYDFLSRVEKEYLAKSKGDVFKISKPKSYSYTNSKEMFKSITNSVVTVENENGFGSGIIISEDGYIVTNYHVIAGEKNITVKVGKDARQKAKVIIVNKDYDLAILKIEQKGLIALVFSNEDVNISDEVFAVGTPLDRNLGQTITKGIVSGFRIRNGVNFIQTDVSINSGNSGGPLLNQKGEIIGIATMKASGRGIEGIGFGIPTATILEMLNIKFEN